MSVQDKPQTPDDQTHLEYGNADPEKPTNSTADSGSPAPFEEPFVFTKEIFLTLLAGYVAWMADLFAVNTSSSILASINAYLGPQSTYTFIQLGQLGLLAFLGPIAGGLCDTFGSRYLMLASNIFGILGAGFAGWATNVNMGIAGGIIIGIGASIHVQIWATLAALVPKRHRALAFGLFQLALAPGIAFAPVIAHAADFHGHWRWIFWLPFILYIIDIPLVFFFYHPQSVHPSTGLSVSKRLALFDWIGSFLFFAGVVLFVLGLTLGGNQFTWKSAITLCLTVIGFCLLLFLGVFETFAPLKFPLFPRKAMANFRGVVTILWSLFFYCAAEFAVNNLWGTQVQVLYTQDALKIGWYSSAYTIPMVVFPLISGLLFFRIGYTHFQYLFYLVAMLLCLWCMATVETATAGGITALVALTGGFVSSLWIITLIIVQIEAGPAHIGWVTGLFYTVKNVGGAIGSTTYSNHLVTRFTMALTSNVAVPLAQSGLDPTLIPEVLTALTTGITTAPVLAELTQEQLGIAVSGITKSYAYAFKIIFLISIAYGFAGIVFALFGKSVAPDDSVDAKPAGGPLSRNLRKSSRTDSNV
ncbi:major facilitator superfamily domain-containing protein [Myxozyma melibiosi]|uniref:Major facilitator superfamily domain-containing protein n=1 Tax=Myxozyma melibiosi TaxID=54550 RepID=A0ABR1FD31_9ASCO